MIRHSEIFYVQLLGNDRKEETHVNLFVFWQEAKQLSTGFLNHAATDCLVHLEFEGNNIHIAQRSSFFENSSFYMQKIIDVKCVSD